MIYNSLLSEFGVLGFEFGYTMANPNALLMATTAFQAAQALLADLSASLLLLSIIFSSAIIAFALVAFAPSTTTFTFFMFGTF